MSTQQPNIVYVFCDELRQAAVGCYGQDPVLTPHLDRFAAQSLVLTHCVSNQPVCTPYRGMLFTGRYPFSTGLYTNCNSNSPVHLDDGERCLSDVLADHGYALGYIGKLHLHKPTEECARYGEGPRGNGLVWDAFTPAGPARHSFEFWHSYGCCDRHLDPHYWTSDGPIDQPVKPREWSVKHETDVAVEYIRNADGQHRDPNKPFMLMVSHNPPHMPFDQVPEEYAAPFRDKPVDELLNRGNVQYRNAEHTQREAANYFGAVHGIDAQFQRILDALDEQGLSDNTIVIFTSDHGEMMRSYDRIGKNIWYDESLLVPWLIRWPGHIAARRDDLLFGAIDIYPTLLGLIGLADAAPDNLEGNDRSGIMRGEGGDRPTSAFYLWPILGREAGPWQFDSARGLRTHRHTFILGRTEEGSEMIVLHDNVADPYQLHNAAAAQPEVAAELRSELERWLERTNDPWTRGEYLPVHAD
jgi:arylsulfatase A-like enzyme